MIQEYYLHLFFGVNGENDFSTGAGRVAIAALMSGYGLNATTKKDLQTRINWRTTPGCFLGQKEIHEDYNTRNNYELKFLANLVQYQKVNRSYNYILNWGVLNEEWDYSCTSSVWIAIAKIYWSGYFLFGRNVIPDAQMGILRAKFTRQFHEKTSERANLRSPFIMQFFSTCGFLSTPISAPGDHLFKDTSGGELPRDEVFGSLLLSLNFSSNIPGFFFVAGLLPHIMARGDRYDKVQQNMIEWHNARPGRAANHLLPLNQQYYYSLGMGRPSIPRQGQNISIRDTITLLFCRLDRTPQEEASTSYFQVHDGEVNWDIIAKCPHSYIAACMVYEYYLFGFGQEIFNLERLKAVRVDKGWEEDYLLTEAMSADPLSTKNCTVREIFRFHLERQNLV